MSLTTQDVRHVAELAKLKLTDAEVDQFAQQLSAILDYAEILQQVDTSHVPPTPYVLPLQNVMRDDESMHIDHCRESPGRARGIRGEDKGTPHGNTVIHHE